MARVLLVGSGPLPSCNPESLGFPQLRCSHFLKALQTEHEVALVLLQKDSDPVPDGLHHLALDRDHPSCLEKARAFAEEFAPDAVVGGGPYGPAWLASRLAGDRPLWVDIPGDPFAEAQAKSAHTGESGHTAAMRMAYSKALQRADAFSVVSFAQRHALQGQLGFMGRLETAPIHRDWIHVVPVGYGFGELPSRSGREARESELVVALCGGYNTWTDGETLIRGLLKGMKRCPQLRVISTGGAIPGHHSATYEAFRAQALASPFANRFTFHGWVSHRALPDLLAKADVGICLDRAGVEPELGSRTRVLFYLHQGLEVVATTGSELCKQLEGLRMIHAVERENPEALAKKLVEMYRSRERSRMVERAQLFLEQEMSPQTIFKPLLSWAKDPFRVDEGIEPAVELAEEIHRLRRELSGVYESPTWKAAGAADRFIKRRSKTISGWWTGKDRSE